MQPTLVLLVLLILEFKIFKFNLALDHNKEIIVDGLYLKQVPPLSILEVTFSLKKKSKNNSSI